MATYVELQIDQGAAFTTTITVSDVAGNTSNLVGYTANAQMRRVWSSVTSTPFKTTFTDAANGQLTMSMTSANTTILNTGRHVYDLKLIDPTGESRRVFEGIVVVNPSVSR
jgi:hypothetical protein